jgi:hypothetical protein
MSTTHEYLQATNSAAIKEAFKDYAETKSYKNTIELVFSGDRELISQAIWALFRAGYICGVLDQKK